MCDFIGHSLGRSEDCVVVQDPQYWNLSAIMITPNESLALWEGNDNKPKEKSQVKTMTNNKEKFAKMARRKNNGSPCFVLYCVASLKHYYTRLF